MKPKAARFWYSCIADAAGVGHYVVTHCNSSFADCDGNAVNGRETNITLDVNHCQVRCIRLDLLLPEVMVDSRREEAACCNSYAPRMGVPP